MASDEGDGKVSKSADDVRDEFEEKMDRLRRQYERDLHSFRYEIEEREYRLKAYEDKFNKIKQPPLLYAYVVRKEGPDLDGNQVVVARATELLKVSTGLVDKTSLGLGQYVWVHPQTYAIVEGSATRNSGVIAKVMDILEGRLVVSIEGDMEKRLVECEKSLMKKLKPGFQISVLPPTMELLEVLPNLEVKSLLLGEKPNVTYAMIGGLSEHIERIRDVVVLPFQEAKLFEQIKLVAPKGILLFGPYRRMPFGATSLICSNSFASWKGSTTTSRIRSMCSDRPPIIAYVTFGFSPRRRDFTSRFGRTSSSSIVGGRTLIWNPGFSFFMRDFSHSTSRFSMSPSMLTTSLPSRMSMTFAITPELRVALPSTIAYVCGWTHTYCPRPRLVLSTRPVETLRSSVARATTTWFPSRSGPSLRTTYAYRSGGCLILLNLSSYAFRRYSRSSISYRKEWRSRSYCLRRRSIFSSNSSRTSSALFFSSGSESTIRGSPKY